MTPSVLHLEQVYIIGKCMYREERECYLLATCLSNLSEFGGLSHMVPWWGVGCILCSLAATFSYHLLMTKLSFLAGTWRDNGLEETQPLLSPPFPPPILLKVTGFISFWLLLLLLLILLFCFYFNQRVSEPDGPGP